jgi:hypothetical protein
MGVRLPLPAPCTFPSKPFPIINLRRLPMRRGVNRVPMSGTKSRYSLHPIHFEYFRWLWGFYSVAKMSSVSPVYARLRNAQGIRCPLTVSRLFLYTSAIIRPILKLPSTIEFLKDLLGDDAHIEN